MRIAAAKSSLQTTHASHTGRSTTGIDSMFNTLTCSHPDLDYDGSNGNTSLDNRDRV
jgi:hypothetical protein